MKKLVLYSDQEIPENAKVDRALLALLNKPEPKIGYIPSSSDPERRFFNNRKEYYAALGIDLAVYFELDVNYEPEKLSSLMQCDGIHLTGGNTYHFLYWLRARGMIEQLRGFVERGGVLIGASAGSILMTPEISVSAYCADVPYPGEVMDDLSALNLVHFAFFPHINVFTDHRALMIKYSKTHLFPIYGCADGNGIVVNGDQVEFIGTMEKAENGIFSTK